MDPPSAAGGWPQRQVVVRDVAAMLARRKRVILGIMALSIALAAAYSYTRPATYTAKAELLVSPVLSPLDASSTSNASNTSAETETRVVTSLAVAEIAKKTLSSSLDAAVLANNTSADMSQGSLILAVSYSGSTPGQARDGANAFASAYLSYREQLAVESVQQKSESLVGRLRSVNERIRAINAKIASEPSNSTLTADLRNQTIALQAFSVALRNQLVAFSSLTTTAGQVIQAASAPSSPASPRHTLDLTLGAIVGLILGTAVALVRDGPRHPLRYSDILEEAIGAPVLASIPKTRRRRAAVVVTREPGSHAAHSYRTLRAALLAKCSGTGIKTILVTSANAGDGKTATAANLAAALAELGNQVVLISADLRRPGLDRAFGFGKVAGLMEVLQGGIQPHGATYPTKVPNLRIVPAGVFRSSADPSNLLQSERMNDMLASCQSADYVVLDSPPILEVSDAIVLGQISDAILFVADGKRTERGAVVLARHHIEPTGTPIIGAVLIRAEMVFSYRGDRRSREVAQRRPPTVATAESSKGFRRWEVGPPGTRPDERAGYSPTEANPPWVSPASSDPSTSAR